MKSHKNWTQNKKNNINFGIVKEGPKTSSKYKVHKLDYKVMIDPNALETLLNSINGEIISIIPNVTSRHYEYSTVDFLLIVEKAS